MILERDGYAKEKPIVVSDDQSRIEFTIEKREATAHQTTQSISGPPPGRYDVKLDNTSVGTFDISGTGDHKLTLPVGTAPEPVVRISRL